ncbi:MAG: carboxypeptidase M32 [Anaerolineales bacterium]|nr:MAG: carboxypeptidase M32 [Anaerolineales bacterium]
MIEKLNELKTILAEVEDLRTVSDVLGYDQQTQMPPGGAEARGTIMATVGRITQETFISDKVGKLLDDLEGYAKDLDPDSDDARLIKVTRRKYDKATRVPPAMVAERAKLSIAANQDWVEAKGKSDWSIFEPHMEKLIDYMHRYAGLFEPYDHVYDPLLDDYETNMKTADVKEIFENIRPKQVELIEAIAQQPQIDDSFLHQHFDAGKQLEVSREVITKIGYDWDRGRMDEVHHPFAQNLGYGDQRITYWMDEEFFNPHLFAGMHEAGHATYEQGVPKDFFRTPLYGGTSYGFHESQSRMWENLVGRSKAFWEWYYPTLQGHFSSQFGKVSLDEFYNAINKVEPSLIRVEADEATYNLHIMLRMEIEIELMEGKTKVKDLPEIWNARFKQYLGISPPDDAQGVLQDVHWSFFYVGYFSTYSLGNLVSVQLWEKINEDIPDLDDHIRKGEFSILLDWLNEKVHRHGSKFEPQELVERITGSKIDGAPYIKYLNEKYSEIYGL